MTDISFKSRINFVNKATFSGFQRGVYIDFRPVSEHTAIDIIKMKEIKKSLLGKIRNPRLDVVKSDEFYTDTVRTCTAGGVVDTKKGESVGFHIFDSLYNFEKIDEILDNIFRRIENPDRALLIGSNNLKCADFSVQIFQKIYDGLMKRIKDISVFREHVFPYSESNLHYSAKDDLWTIQSMYRPYTTMRESDVLSKEDLNRCFKEVKITNDDIVEFKTA